MIYKPNKQKCIESNATAYKRKPVYVRARKKLKPESFEISFIGLKGK